MKKRVLTIVLAIVAFMAALGITLYPLISTHYNEKHQSLIHFEHQEKVQQVDNSGIRKAMEEAQAYNEAIRPKAVTQDAYSKDALKDAAEGYLEQLNVAGDDIMGYVEVPQISINLPIYHGTDDLTLEAGIGHLLGSSLPIGGESTHCVLTGHSGMANEKFFSDLTQIELGEVFYIHVLNETHAYQVDQIKTVLPHETDFLQIETGEDLCTLVTCVPFGINTHRLLVRGTRIPYEEAEEIVEQLPEPVKQTSNWEQQYIKGLLIGFGIVAAGGCIAGSIWLYRRWRRGKR